MDLAELKISLSEIVDTQPDGRTRDILAGVQIPTEARDYRRSPRSLMALAEAPNGIIVGVAAAALLEHQEKPPILYVVSVDSDRPYKCRELDNTLLSVLLNGAKEIGAAGIWFAAEVTQFAEPAKLASPAVSTTIKSRLAALWRRIIQ